MWISHCQREPWLKNEHSYVLRNDCITQYFYFFNDHCIKVGGTDSMEEAEQIPLPLVSVRLLFRHLICLL